MKNKLVLVSSALGLIYTVCLHSNALYAQNPPPPPAYPALTPPPPPDDQGDVYGQFDNPSDSNYDQDAPSSGGNGSRGIKSKNKVGIKSAKGGSPAAGIGAASGTETAPEKKVPPGKDLVSINFPEPTELKDIIKAVGEWMGKNFILSKTVSNKISIISPQLVTKEEAYQAFLSALNVAGYTTVETGKFVKIVPTNAAPGANIKTFYGASWAPATDETITQIIPLTYLTSAEIANSIRSTLRLSSNISAFPTTNSLIITDTGHKVRRLLELIRILDIKGNQPQFVMEPLKNTDATDISKKITELFSVRGGSSSPYLQKVIVDQRTNSLILVGPSKGLDDVARVIRRLDKASEDQSSQLQIHIRPLEYAEAEKLATTLQSLATGSKGGNRSSLPRPNIPSYPSPMGGSANTATVVADLGDVKITADKPTNSLIINASKAAYMELETIIQSLDKRRDQVYLEVDVLDINMTNDYNYSPSVLAGTKAGNGKYLVPFAFNPKAYGGLAASAATGGVTATTAQSIGDLLQSSGSMVGLMGTQKITVGGIELSPGALLTAIKNDGNSNVLQTPSLLVANNEQALFNATERQHYQDTTLDATGHASSQKWQPIEAQLDLQIKPQISEADYVNLDIKITADRFGSSRGAGAPPDRNSRKTTTLVTVLNQQTIVLSGLVRDQETETQTKVPLLGDIPVLGWFFRQSSKTKDKTNLAIFITPYIVRDAADLAKIYEKKAREREEFLRLFYGKDYKENPVFSRMPSLEQGKVPPPRATPVPVPTVKPGSQEGDEKEAPLPSQDPEPVVVPGGSGGGGSSMPAPSGFDVDPGMSGGNYDPGSMGGNSNMSSPPVPPPPPPPGSDNQ